MPIVIFDTPRLASSPNQLSMYAFPGQEPTVRLPPAVDRMGMQIPHAPLDPDPPTVAGEPWSPSLPPLIVPPPSAQPTPLSSSHRPPQCPNCPNQTTHSTSGASKRVGGGHIRFASLNPVVHPNTPRGVPLADILAFRSKCMLDANAHLKSGTITYQLNINGVDYPAKLSLPNQSDHHLLSRFDLAWWIAHAFRETPMAVGVNLKHMYLADWTVAEGESTWKATLHNVAPY
ncbi:hypothetical protein FB45DRAFT_1040112 [Roridomyces roridus]|uniref:Uncharacterized protein n=1 Tax=Roridomyces roridus TaxID=1738132 RepID=A0AAD7B1D5_9AGAR|nr:hypothetical protein FB45DRAFT_1040112 [Roridomyces roridus]